MGPDVRVLDHMVFTADAKEISPVDEEMKKMLAELVARVAKLEAGEVGEKPAADEDAPPPAKAEEKPAADEDPAKAEEKPAADEDPAAAAEEAKAMDALSKSIKALAAKVDALSSKPAMDEAAFVATLGRKTDLAARIAQHVGVFDHSRMTLPDVVKYGVEKLGLKNVPAGQEAVALDAALQVRQVPTVAAMDRASTPSPLRSSIAAYATEQ